jgi:CheY-like chemotaxis protein
MTPPLLIVESDTALCRLYERFLRAHGYGVETAADGLSCLAKLRRGPPAVLVLDLEICWGGGEGVLAWLREEPPTAWVPTILTATAGLLQPPAHLGAPPVVQCLLKPFSLAALLEGVRSAAANGLPRSRNGRCEPGFLGPFS